MMSNMKYAVPFIIILFLLGVMWTELSANRSEKYSSGIVGDKVPTFSVPSLDGVRKLTTQDFKGRVVILNFFASWCTACRAEHPMLMKIKNTYHVPVYGIAFRDDPKDTREYLNQEGNPYLEAGYDQNGDTAVDFGIYATPETFVISPAGDIIYKQIGVISQETWDTDIYPLIKKYQP